MFVTETQRMLMGCAVSFRKFLQSSGTSRKVSGWFCQIAKLLRSRDPARPRSPPSRSRQVVKDSVDTWDFACSSRQGCRQEGVRRFA
jgi:hypothetical protein